MLIKVCGIVLAVVAVVTIGLLFGIPVYERIKICKEQYGKDWKKHF